MIEIEGFETPEESGSYELETDGLIITLSGEGVKNIDNISIYFKGDKE